jgi:DNA polymerase alpha-associated DNA helicase A
VSDLLSEITRKPLTLNIRIKLANTVVHARMEKVLLRLLATFPADGEGSSEASKVELNSLISVLLSQQPPSSPPSNPENVDFFDLNLNESQKSAVVFSLNQPEIAIIHGPPGKFKPSLRLQFITQIY